MSEVPFDLQRLRSAEIAKGSVTEASHASEVSSRQRSRRSARTVSQVGQHPPLPKGVLFQDFKLGLNLHYSLDKGSPQRPRNKLISESSHILLSLGISEKIRAPNH